MRSNVRTGWIAVGGVLTVLAVLGVALAVWIEVTRVGVSQEATRRLHSFTSPTIVVDTTGHVNVSVVSGTTEQLVVMRELSWIQNKPAVTEAWDGRTLRIGVTCPGDHLDGGLVCQANYTLTLPAATDVEVKSPEGSVMANGISGDLRLSTISGDVIVDNTLGRLWARAEEGSVIGSGLRSAEADVEVGSGNAILGFTEPPTSVKAVVRTGGDVEVTVPYGDSYRVEADASDKTIDVQLDPEASRKITALTAHGSLRIFSFGGRAGKGT